MTLYQTWYKGILVEHLFMNELKLLPFYDGGGLRILLNNVNNQRIKQKEKLKF